MKKLLSQIFNSFDRKQKIKKLNRLLYKVNNPRPGQTEFTCILASQIGAAFGKWYRWELFEHFKGLGIFYSHVPFHAYVCSRGLPPDRATLQRLRVDFINQLIRDLQCTHTH